MVDSSEVSTRLKTSPRTLSPPLQPSLHTYDKLANHVATESVKKYGLNMLGSFRRFSPR